MQVPGPHATPTKSDPLSLGPSNLHFKQTPEVCPLGIPIHLNALEPYRFKECAIWTGEGGIRVVLLPAPSLCHFLLSDSPQTSYLTYPSLFPHLYNKVKITASQGHV